jgi:cold shock protein
MGATVCGMWATLETWLLGDGEVPELRIDEVLPHKGLRLSCEAFGPSAETAPGAWAIGAATKGDITSRLRGAVVAAWRQAAVIDIGGCLVLLEPGAVRAIQTADGHEALERYSADFETPSVGAMGEAVGRLEVVPDYEWEAFHQFDVRRDWRLTGVLLIDRQPVFQATRMEQLDIAADSNPSNCYLVNLEPAHDVTASMVPAEPTAQNYAIEAVVREWRPEEGWGVVDSPQTPGGCWVHFSHIQATGYRKLVPGKTVALEFEPADQDGFTYRAVTVEPL